MVTYILLALGGFSAIFFLLFRDKDGGVLPTALKTLTSLLFVATAIAAIVGNYNLTGAASFKKTAFMGLIVMGLVCDLVGDVFLDLKITYLETNVRHSDLYTYIGMIVFSAGHILYIIAVSIFYGFTPWTILIAVGGAASVFGAGMFLMKLDFGKFLIPTIIYVFLLAFFIACSATAGVLTSFNLSIVLLLVSSVMFLASDMFLGLIYFDGNESKIIIVIDHALYYGAQFLLALSLLYVGVRV